MFTARRPALRPRDLFRRGVGSILEIGPPRSRFHEFVPRETAAEAFARYRAEIERDLGAAVARWEAEVGGTPAAESPEEPLRGPLPPPELLRRYDEAVPGAGERILDLAEEEQRKRASAVNGAVETMRRGQFCGLASGPGRSGGRGAHCVSRTSGRGYDPRRGDPDQSGHGVRRRAAQRGSRGAPVRTGAAGALILCTGIRWRRRRERRNRFRAALDAPPGRAGVRLPGAVILRGWRNRAGIRFDPDEG